MNRRIPVGLAVLLGVVAWSVPAAARSPREPLAGTSPRYAVTPYYLPDGSGGPYHVSSVQIGDTAGHQRRLVTSPNVALIPVASRGKRLLVDEDTPGSGESRVAIVKQGHLHEIFGRGEDFAAGFMPNGDAIVIDGSVQKIYRVSPTGRHHHVVFQLPSRAFGVGGSLSSDGRFLYFVGAKDGDGRNPHHVFRLTIATGHLKKLPIAEPRPWGLSDVQISPNGRVLAVSLGLSPKRGGAVTRIGVASAHGGKLTVIKDRWSKGKRDADPHGLTRPFFSPDSQHILTSYTTRSDHAGLVSVTFAPLSYHLIPGGKGVLSGPPL